MQKILDWSEAWVVLVPIVAYMIRRPKPKYFDAIFFYLIFAFIANFFSDWIVENYYHEPKWIKDINYNQPIYNIHSTVRQFLLAYFFTSIGLVESRILKFIILVLPVIFFAVNFSIIDSLKNFSSSLFAFESVFLLALSFSFFLQKLKSEDAKVHAVTYVTSAIAFYEAVCFPIFLFYDTLVKETADFAVDIWDVHNIAYIIFCVLIAKSFYVNG